MIDVIYFYGVSSKGVDIQLRIIKTYSNKKIKSAQIAG